MTKRKNKKRQKRKPSKPNINNYKLINFLLVIIIALILTIAYILYTNETKELKKSKEVKKKVETVIKKEFKQAEKKADQELNKYFDKIEIKKDEFEEYTKHLYEEYIDKDLIHEQDKTNQITKEENKPKKEAIEKAVFINKPKLAIIIDDVSTKRQINEIHNLGYTVTPSIMPPTKSHPNSAKIAKNLPFYMIHFPLEASTFKGEENDTLHVGDSYEKIEKRVAKIRDWYPNAKYTNNHTGSKFTADTQSMDYLYKALKKYDFIFMDSRTTSKTKAKQMAKKYNMPYIVRNIFLDNEQDFTYIQNQLKKAIKIAKKRGFSIAIGHPHSITMKTLKESKHLLKDLDMVYLYQLPNLSK